MDPKVDLTLRKTYRCQLTKLCNNVKDIVSKDNELEYIAIECERIKSLRVTLNELNAKVMSTLTEENMESECEKISEYDCSAIEAIARLEVCIRLRTQEKNEQRLRSNSNGTNMIPIVQVEHEQMGSTCDNYKNNTRNTHQKTVRLPKLDLLKFNGDLEAWPAFWEQYNQAIHNNSELDNISKFTYLKSLLTGQAAISISGLTSSSSAYNDSIEILKQEYGQSERIVNNYVNKLLSIPPITYDKDCKALRRLYNTASSITRSLNTLGVSANQYGLMVKSIIFKILPHNLRIQFNKFKLNVFQRGDLSNNDSEIGSDTGDSDINYSKQVTDLLEFIKIEVDSLEQAMGQGFSSSKTFPKNNFSQSKPESKSNNNVCSAQGLLTTSQEHCLFCKSRNHETKNCKIDSMTLNDKKAILKNNFRCFRCAGLKHTSKFCKTKGISCTKCKGRHVTALCDPTYRPSDKSNESTSNNDQSTVTTFTGSRILDVYLQTACVYLKSEDNDLLVRAIIDGGSQLTFIKECVSRDLNLPVVGVHKISICSFGSSKQGVARLCNKVKISLKSQFNKEIIELEAIEAPEICFDSISPPSQQDPIIKKFSEEYKLADSRTDRLDRKGISLLIGADNYWSIVMNETRYLTNKLTAINSRLGWTIHGSSNFTDTSDISVHFNIASILHIQTCEEAFESFNESKLKSFWDLETTGITTEEAKKPNELTDTFIENNIIFKDKRYEVTLPWQTDKKLDSYYTGALIRVRHLINKLCKHEKILEYDQAVREYVKLGCAEMVNETDMKREGTYYLPHRPVYRRDKETSQVRVVFDASAHVPGMLSLNDKLLTGENLIPDITKILLNFRMGAVGLIADIEKAFLQISLNKDDRDFHRFLWFKYPINEEITSIEQLPELAIFRMNRVTFGVTTSPFLLAATLRKHLLSQADREIGKILLNSFYVDDCVLSANSTKEAFNIYEKSKEIMNAANMNLRKWCSNDLHLMNQFDVDKNNSKTNLCKKVLGIIWYSVTDQLVVALQDTSNDTDEPTKRIVLKAVASIFDPLGTLGPYVIQIKILLQKMCKQKLNWDETLPDDLKTEWKQWKYGVTNLHDFSIPRCILPDKNIIVELHIFADASPRAYGVVAYLKILSSGQSNFLIAKNRVAPLKQKLTLPKLELTAALCAARLQKYIVDTVKLNIKEVFLWSDSKITLYWIKGKKAKWKPYIENRVNEIRSISQVSWRFCPGKDNPADLLTRGLSSTKFLKETNQWLYGPPWLHLEQSNWPLDEALNEQTEVELALELICFMYDDHLKQIEDIQPILTLKDYSNYEKVLRITALTYRFINNANRKKTKIFGKVTSDEIKMSELYWIRIVQHEEYFEEICLLIKGKQIPRKSSILLLNPFLDDNKILRLGGRLQDSYLSFSEKHPAILPKKSILSEKIIWQAHEESMHRGVNATLAITRQKYWIIQGRQRIKSVISKCITCKKLKGKSCMEPFAPLPRDRIIMTNPFKATGIDFAGPLYIKQDDGKKIKVHIMLFTCAVIRAVHIELVKTLSTESCLLGLRRFIARRGVPNVIYSDNAKTFKRTAMEIDELLLILKDDKIQDLARMKRIQWKFSIERGSWWGGFWERLVRTVKDSLKVTLGRKLLNFEELQTILTEVEATVNSRPLTYIDDDPTNLFILTPSKFLIGMADIGFSMDLKAPGLNRNEILKTWKKRETTMNQFWKRWQEDYLKQLRSAHQTDKFKSHTIKKGDIVILHDQDKPRLMWKLVRVVQTFQGRDGRTRACEIVTSEGTQLRRPIQLLYPLEIHSFSPGEDVENSEVSQSTP